MIRVLFVCTANISRSPYLERRGRQLIDSEFAAFASAGTHSLPDREMDPMMVAELAARGGDPSGHRSQRLCPDLLAWADVILGVSAEHRTAVLGQRPDLARQVFTVGQFLRAAQTVRDPQDLVSSAFRFRGGTPAADDLADPYGRGRVAASACAARADEYLLRLRAVLQQPARVDDQ